MEYVAEAFPTGAVHELISVPVLFARSYRFVLKPAFSWVKCSSAPVQGGMWGDKTNQMRSILHQVDSVIQSLSIESEKTVNGRRT